MEGVINSVSQTHGDYLSHDAWTIWFLRVIGLLGALLVRKLNLLGN